MMKLHLIAISILAGGAMPYAQGDTAIEPYQPKNKSSFSVQSGARVPFWPIGWSKEKQSAAPEAVAPAPVKVFLIEPQHFTVTSVLLSHPPLATINGKAFGEGEFLPVTANGQPLKVVVKAIRDGGVWLDQSGHQIFVPLKRQGIPPPKPNDPNVGPSEFKINIGEPGKR